MTRLAVVVSTWIGNPPEYLLGLCGTMGRKAAGAAFDLFLSANGLGYRVPEPVAGRFSEIFVRENTGYNLGAWDHAWRRLPDYGRFLFLQDDCAVLRRNWLQDFTQRFDETRRCGLVGEHFRWDEPWGRLVEEQAPEPGLEWEGKPVSRARYYRATLRRWGIPEGPTARHLTSVVHFTSRPVLEAVDGYRQGRTYHEAIAAEIGFSRAIEAAGFQLAQVTRRRHSRIGHREWESRGALRRLGRWLASTLEGRQTSGWEPGGRVGAAPGVPFEEHDRSGGSVGNRR